MGRLFLFVLSLVAMYVGYLGYHRHLMSETTAAVVVGITLLVSFSFVNRLVKEDSR